MLEKVEANNYTTLDLREKYLFFKGLLTLVRE